MPDFVNVWGHMYIGDGSPNHNTSLAFLLQLPPYYRNTKYIYIFSITTSIKILRMMESQIG